MRNGTREAAASRYGSDDRMIVVLSATTLVLIAASWLVCCL